jgi:hypothetical protein
MSSYGPVPKERGKLGLLVGLGVALVVIATGAVVWLTQRGESGGTATSTATSTMPITTPSTAPTAAPSTAPNVVQVGGVTTGQAKALSDALTAKGLDCTVQFTITAGGNAGCFSWADKGRTSTEALFQYQTDGTVIGLNVKTDSPQDGVSLAALASALQTVAPIVFAADQDKVAQAVAALGTTDDTTFDGTWGKYQVHDGAGGSTVSAAKSGSSRLSVPRIEMVSRPAELADGLADKGLTCNVTRESCNGTFRGDLGRMAVLSSGLGSGGIMHLIVAADDTARDADAGATKKAFTDLVRTTFGIARGNGLADVQKWFADHLDGESHSAYVGGWRADLVVKYGTAPGAPGLANDYELTVRGDARWTVPGQ